jgi:two-component system, cell cycle response regulator DivK
MLQDAPMKKKMILLVEDHPDNVVVYRTILEHYGYRVLTATNGHDGIRLATDELPDLILMDISLPHMDGCEATRRLKAAERTRHIPVVAVTAHSHEEFRTRAREAGCNGFLVKPVAPSLVADEVARHIGKPTAAVAAQ